MEISTLTIGDSSFGELSFVVFKVNISFLQKSLVNLGRTKKGGEKDADQLIGSGSFKDAVWFCWGKTLNSWTC